MANRLTLDAIAAREAGMSYGQWMAMMQGKERPEPELKPDPTPNGARACVICGRLFYSKRRNQICCSKDCSYKRELETQRAYRLKKNEEARSKDHEPTVPNL